MNLHSFDASNIRWQPLGDLEHVHYWMLGIDEQNKIADTLFKFGANQKIVRHRHTSLTHTFVVQGEHCIFDPDGRLKDARPTGLYTVGPANPGSRREGGGDGQDVIVLMSFRSSASAVIELLDEQENPLDTLTLQGWAEMVRAQRVAEREKAA